jgi:hypothetical protein
MAGQSVNVLKLVNLLGGCVDMGSTSGNTGNLCEMASHGSACGLQPSSTHAHTAALCAREQVHKCKRPKSSQSFNKGLARLHHPFHSNPQETQHPQFSTPHICSHAHFQLQKACNTTEVAGQRPCLHNDCYLPQFWVNRPPHYAIHQGNLT